MRRSDFEDGEDSVVKKISTMSSVEVRTHVLVSGSVDARVYGVPGGKS